MTDEQAIIEELRSLAETNQSSGDRMRNLLRQAANYIEAQAAEIAALRQPDARIAREAFFRMPEPHEYLSKDQLKGIRSYLDALQNWKHRYGPAMKEPTNEPT